MHDTYFWNLKVSSFNPSLLFHGYWKYFRDIASEGWYARVCVYEARAKELSTRMSKREKDGPLKRGAWPRDSALSEYINDGLLVWSTV